MIFNFPLAMKKIVHKKLSHYFLLIIKILIRQGHVHHVLILNILFKGWKNEHVVYEDEITNSRIITIEPNDPKHCWKKVEEILELINQDLGLNDIEITNCTNRKVNI